MKKSALQIARAAYRPQLPIVLTGGVKVVEGQPTQSAGDQEEIKNLFPNTYGLPEIIFEKATENEESEPVNVGVILSGGQAPGGHNVISGLFDGIKSINRKSRLYGFLMGPGGLVNHEYKELTAEIIDEYRNTGGFDIIGSGRTKLETKEQFDKGLEILRELDIKALVIIGGDDSNTNAAILAEYYKAIGAGVQVIGVPKTIDGDLKNNVIETSFGFDTATKVYSEVIGNIQRDCNSAKKYWHFIKLMGRSASHIALECALQCQPNICIISEEVEAKNMTLDQVVNEIAEAVVARANMGLNYGVVLIPEGLIEFIPAVKALIAELNDLLAAKSAEFASIAPEDQRAWVQVSLIETEKLLSEMVGKRLEQLTATGEYKGKYATMHHFFGYEGRCADPSNFDANYCYGLGFTAACLIRAGVTGYMSSLRNLTFAPVNWISGGIPITMMMNMERRHGEMKPVIRKALVELDGAPFLKFAKERDAWKTETCYTYPGPIQYFGPVEVCDQPSKTLVYEQKRRKY